MTHIILGTAHLKSTPGKCSPDKKFFEYLYSRKIVNKVYTKLKEKGYNVYIDVPEEDLKITSNQELAYRCKIVNNYCKKFGTANCIYVSIHVNAAGGDGKWHTATGWEAYTTRGVTKSDKLADCLYKAAEVNLKGKKIRKDLSDKDPDKEANFYVIKHSYCPAVLTENFFQDNKDDVEFLESEEGTNKIVNLHVEGIIDYIKDK